MRELRYLISRDTKLFFKDKGMFFTSLITPLILLVLFVSFLGNVYRDSLNTLIPEGMQVSESLVEALVGGWLFSSLLAVCCVTVSFCANMLMVQDKVTGARRDLTMTPVHSSKLAIGYYISTLTATFIICGIALGACFIYLGITGWYLTVGDVLFAVMDVFLLVMFGTALSSVINFFLNSQGQMSAVGTIVSAGYGFLCGAYMPISQFSEGIQKFIMFLPGTYGTALLHSHLLRGPFAEMESNHLPAEAVEGMRDAFDSNLYFFGDKVSPEVMYMVLIGAVVALILVYVLLNGKSRKVK